MTTSLEGTLKIRLEGGDDCSRVVISFVKIFSYCLILFISRSFYATLIQKGNVIMTKSQERSLKIKLVGGDDCSEFVIDFIKIFWYSFCSLAEASIPTLMQRGNNVMRRIQEWLLKIRLIGGDDCSRFVLAANKISWYSLCLFMRRGFYSNTCTGRKSGDNKKSGRNFEN